MVVPLLGGIRSEFILVPFAFHAFLIRYLASWFGGSSSSSQNSFCGLFVDNNWRLCRVGEFELLAAARLSCVTSRDGDNLEAAEAAWYI